MQWCWTFCDVRGKLSEVFFQGTKEHSNILAVQAWCWHKVHLVHDNKSKAWQTAPNRHWIKMVKMIFLAFSELQMADESELTNILRGSTVCCSLCLFTVHVSVHCVHFVLSSFPRASCGAKQRPFEKCQEHRMKCWSSVSPLSGQL